MILIVRLTSGCVKIVGVELRGVELVIVLEQKDCPSSTVSAAWPGLHKAAGQSRMP